MSASMLPLHTPIPTVFTGLKVKQLYGMQQYPRTKAKVTFPANSDEVIVEKSDDGDTSCGLSFEKYCKFCSSTCYEIVRPLRDGELWVNIRHGCVDGWRFLFTAPDEAELTAFKDALMRRKGLFMFSYNVLLPDRCKLLKLYTPCKLTAAQCKSVREETTPALPKGTAAQLSSKKSMPSSATVYLGMVNLCTVGRLLTNGKTELDSVIAGNGKVIVAVDNDGSKQVVEITAADYLPPRLVTPYSASLAMYVCDSRNTDNFKQAWIFSTPAVHSKQLAETLIHAWMVVDAKKSATAPAKKVVKATPKTKKNAPKKEEEEETEDTASEGDEEEEGPSTSASAANKKKVVIKKTTRRSTAASINVVSVKKASAKKVNGASGGAGKTPSAKTPVKKATPKKTAAPKRSMSAPKKAISTPKRARSNGGVVVGMTTGAPVSTVPARQSPKKKLTPKSVKATVTNVDGVVKRGRGRPANKKATVKKTPAKKEEAVATGGEAASGSGTTRPATRSSCSIA